MKPITIRSKIDAHVFSDFSKFNCFTLHHRWVWLVLFPILMTLFAYCNLVTGSNFLFRLFLAIGIATPICYIWFYKVSLKNQIKASGLATPRLSYTLALSHDEISVSNESEKVSYQWSQIYRVYKTPKYIFLYITKARSFILPYADMEGGTPEDLWNLIKSSADSIRLFKVKK